MTAVPRRVAFPAYDAAQLAEILNARDGAREAFEVDAVRYASRLVANMHGDARRLLDVARTAARAALDERGEVSARDAISSRVPRSQRCRMPK